ncbi:hypothetical protein HFP15_13735 [Amycolatopsis sp. K13G38]|uniref:CoA transferase n=2 Tax=Amycolatopsis acididurans TaxID=2724524 RepID=A0ABX1J2D8_9PSEU|nr:hypothetical protein [Amycolatopsis acididurans]
MALTGRRAGPALRAPGEPASAAWGALLALELLARIGGREVVLPGPRVLGERAAIAGLGRNAPSSPSGTTRLVRAADGWVAVNLARGWPDLPETDPWSFVELSIAGRPVAEIVEKARTHGFPVGVPATEDDQLAARGQEGEVWPFVLNGRVRRARPCEEYVRTEPRRWRLPPTRVVDVSSLWAGPLCGHLLTSLGARVIKVEDVRRPDPARQGPGEFFDLLHAGQESVALDLGTAGGRAALDRLIGGADVVIGNEHPPRGGKCWVSITAYGRTGPWAGAPGFGDDTAVAGGLVAWDPATGIPAPCGDAIAAPLAGVNAALAAVACRLAGGEWLVDVALREQAAATLTGTPEPGPVPAAAAPVARRPAGRAPALGADTARVLAES